MSIAIGYGSDLAQTNRRGKLRWLLSVLAMAILGFGRSGADAESAKQFALVVEPHIDAAYSLARYLVRDATLAEDITQEACLRAFRGISGYRGGNAKAWVLQIVRRCALDVIAKRRGSDPLHQAEEITPQVEPIDWRTPEKDLENTGESRDVRQLIQTLPEDLRVILVLREIEHLSYREIADVIDRPVGTVMSRLARARRAFAALWNDQDGGRR